MKKVMAIISSVILCFALASCSLDSIKNGDFSQDKSSSAAEQSEAESSESELSQPESSMAEGSSESSESSEAVQESIAESAVAEVTESIAKEDESETEQPEEENTDSENSVQIGSVQEFVEMNQAAFDAAKKQLEDSSLTMDIYAKGNSLVYSYTYTSEDVVANDELRNELNKSLDKQSDTFCNVLNSIKLVVPSAESVIVEYKDSTGELITTREFMP